MRFHEWISQYEIIKTRVGIDSLKAAAKRHKTEPLSYVYARELTALRPSAKRGGDNNRLYNTYLTELAWIRSLRPYYNIYPAIIKPLLRLNLDKVPARTVQPPLPELVLRLPEEHNDMRVELIGGPFKGETLPVSSILISAGKPGLDMSGNPYPDERPYRYLLVSLQFISPVSINLITNAIRLPDTGDTTVTQEIFENSDVSESDLATDSIKAVYKLVASVCLLSRDIEDNLVVPEVLTDDRRRFEETHDPNLIRRAMKKGKYGFNVGEALEEQMLRPKIKMEGQVVSPHYRSPSPLALYWTGPGSAIPVFKYRAGTFVHKEVLTRMPSGHQGKME